jgi:hypothetical protein
LSVGYDSVEYHSMMYCDEVVWIIVDEEWAVNVVSSVYDCLIVESFYICGEDSSQDVDGELVDGTSVGWLAVPFHSVDVGPDLDKIGTMVVTVVSGEDGDGFGDARVRDEAPEAGKSFQLLRIERQSG